MTSEVCGPRVSSMATGRFSVACSAVLLISSTPIVLHVCQYSRTGMLITFCYNVTTRLCSSAPAAKNVLRPLQWVLVASSAPQRRQILQRFALGLLGAKPSTCCALV